MTIVKSFNQVSYLVKLLVLIRGQLSIVGDGIACGASNSESSTIRVKQSFPSIVCDKDVLV